MTKEVSTYSCMPVVNLYKRESELPDEDVSFELLDEDTPLKAKMSNEDEDSYELDTTKLVQFVAKGLRHCKIAML